MRYCLSIISLTDYSPEENARRKKIRVLLQIANVSSMDDSQDLFRATIAEFTENGPEAEPDYYNNRRIKAKLKGLPPAIHRQQALSVS